MTATRFTIKDNETYQKLFGEKTIFGLKNAQEIANYFNWLQESFPSLNKNELSDKFQKQFANFDENSKINLGVKTILLDKEIVIKAKKEIQQELDKLSSREKLLFDVNPETIKFLKEKIDHGSDFQRLDNLAIWFKFYFQELFLNHLPNELQSELDREPKLALSEMSEAQKKLWNYWCNELLKKTVDQSRSLESESDLQAAAVNGQIEDIYEELVNVIDWLHEDKKNPTGFVVRRQANSIKDISASQWDEIELVINNPSEWLKTLGRTIEGNQNFLKVGRNYGRGDEYYILFPGVLNKFKNWANGKGEITFRTADSSSNIARKKLEDHNSEREFIHDGDYLLPAPFNYTARTKGERLAYLLCEKENKIFQPGKFGVFRSKEAFEYLQEIAGNLTYRKMSKHERWIREFKSWLEVDSSRTSWQNNLDWEALWNLFKENDHEHWEKYVDRQGDYDVKLSSQNAQGLKRAFSKWQESQVGPESKITLNTPKYTNSSSDIVDLRHLRSLSPEVKNDLKGKRIRIDADLLYRKPIKNIDPQNWDIVQFYYTSSAPHNLSPFTLQAGGNPYHGTNSLISDYNQWLSAYPSRSKWRTDQLFKSVSGSYYVCVNEGVLHYLREKFGEREVSAFYNGNNNNLPNEYFVDEFLNDDNLAAAIDRNSPNRMASLSSGSGRLLNLADLPKKQRKELENREIIIQNEVKGYRKRWKDVISSNFGDLRVPLHSFDDLVAKIEKADKEKPKDSSKKLLTPNGRFANQERLDEWKQLVNRTGWYITPVNGTRTRLGDLTTNDRLQGGEVARNNWNITGKGNNYEPQNAYEFIAASLLNNNNTWFRTSANNYTEIGANFLQKIIENRDWEEIEAEVDYKKDKKLFMQEFVNDKTKQDIRVFLIDKNKMAGTNQTGQATDTSSTESALNNVLSQQSSIDNLVKQISQEQQSQITELTKQLLTIIRGRLEGKITTFGNEVNISDNQLQKKYSRDYKEILKENLTLNNEKSFEDTLKAVISLCATEKSTQLANDLAAEDEEDITSRDIKILLSYLEKVKNAWTQIPVDVNISEINNPFYLADISNSKRREFIRKVDELITTWKAKLTQQERQVRQEQTAQIRVNPYERGNK